MNFNVALVLLQDGIKTGSIYALIALGTVLVFNVTRIAFVSFGDLITYSALTLAAIQAGRLPGTIWLLVLLAAISCAMEAAHLVRRRRWARLPGVLALYGAVPLLPVGVALTVDLAALPVGWQMALTFVLVVPLGPLLYRVVFRPMADQSILVLLMAAVALHFVLTGLALLFFGAEGFRTKPYVTGSFRLLGHVAPAATVVIVVATILVVAILYAWFAFTFTGKALRATAVNRIGARLVGIRSAQAGAIAFLCAAILAAITGTLIGPVTTMYFDSGFVIGLKGFVGSVIGGFVSYPAAGLGALLIGILETFSSFYWSDLKDVIVFGSLVPLIILRWVVAGGHDTAEVADEA